MDTDQRRRYVSRTLQVWQNNEAEFQKLRQMALAPAVTQIELNAAAAPLLLLLVTATSAFLGSRRFRGVDCDPEAAAHDWLLKMFKVGFKQYDPERGPFYRYGYKSLAYHCNSLGRRSKHRRAISLIGDQVAETDSPDKQFQLGERKRVLRRAIFRLPKPNRQALILKYWLGRSSREAAGRLGMTAATIDQLNHKSRRLLASDWTVHELLEDYHST